MWLFWVTSSSNVSLHLITVSPRDKEEFGIWKKFVDKISVDLAVVVRA